VRVHTAPVLRLDIWVLQGEFFNNLCGPELCADRRSSSDNPLGSTAHDSGSLGLVLCLSASGRRWVHDMKVEVGHAATISRLRISPDLRTGRVCMLCLDFTTGFIISIPLSPISISQLNIVSFSKYLSHKNIQTLTTKKAAMASTIINWSEIQPHLKWQVLAKQKRFLAWALYSSIGSMMLGTSLNP
jgi:hypothetical protein